MERRFLDQGGGAIARHRAAVPGLARVMGMGMVVEAP
jgi:hypothetical protein